MQGDGPVHIGLCAGFVSRDPKHVKDAGFDNDVDGSFVGVQSRVEQSTDYA